MKAFSYEGQHTTGVLLMSLFQWTLDENIGELAGNYFKGILLNQHILLVIAVILNIIPNILDDISAVV